MQTPYTDNEQVTTFEFLLSQPKKVRDQPAINIDELSILIFDDQTDYGRIMQARLAKAQNVYFQNSAELTRSAFEQGHKLLRQLTSSHVVICDYLLNANDFDCQWLLDRVSKLNPNALKIVATNNEIEHLPSYLKLSADFIMEKSTKLESLIQAINQASMNRASNGEQ